MASIRKRGSKWQVQVRRLGYPPVSKSFVSKADAAQWAREAERSCDRGEVPCQPSSKPQHALLSDLLDRYERAVTANKKGAASERYRIRVLKRELGALALVRLTPAVIAAYRDRRLSGKANTKPVMPATVRREIAVLAHCLELARREWGYDLSSNPVRQVSVTGVARARTRRLEVTDARQLFAALDASRVLYLKPLVLLAIETGMRRSELLALAWSNVCLKGGTAHLADTKNGNARTVPLTPSAISVLATLASEGERQGRVFNVSPNAVRLAWERLRTKVGLPDLRFHDLRHEAVSRFFELGLTTPEVALISGHKDPRMLARYTHLRPVDVAAKLARLAPT